jgi:hypothetical protein
MFGKVSMLQMGLGEEAVMAIFLTSLGRKAWRKKLA